MKNIKKIKLELIKSGLEYKVVDKLRYNLERGGELIHKSLNHFLEMSETSDTTEKIKRKVIGFVNQINDFCDKLENIKTN